MIEEGDFCELTQKENDCTRCGDNYNSFIGVFNSRLDDIRSIYVYFNIHYAVSNDFRKRDYYNQHILQHRLTYTHFRQF